MKITKSWGIYVQVDSSLESSRIAASSDSEMDSHTLWRYKPDKV